MCGSTDQTARPIGMYINDSLQRCSLIQGVKEVLSGGRIFVNLRSRVKQPQIPIVCPERPIYSQINAFE